MLACSRSVDLQRNKLRLRHMLFVFVGHGARLLDSGGSPSVGCAWLLQKFGEFWLAQFGRRAGSGVQPTNRIHSFGVSACHRHHHVAKNICARLSRTGAHRHNHQARTCFRIFASEHDASLLCGESLGLPFVSAFVSTPTRSCDEQSTHSSYHVRCVFLGWVNQQMRTTPKEHEVRRERECHKTAATQEGREHGHTGWPG